MILANATDINQWANRRTAQDQLPRLLRRLVHGTVARVQRISFPADESVQMGGWDGVVVVDEGNAFVPDTVSVWELGTNSDVKSKADGDYLKRCQDPLGLTPANTAFVFVTSRRWGNKDNWVTERNAEGVWREVRAYDAEDIAQWLELAPSVHVWFSKLIGKYPEGVTDFENFWLEWSESTQPPVTPELVLAGREQSSTAVHTWLQGAASATVLQSETQDEALAFFLASLYSMPSAERVAHLARGVIVRDVQAWQHLSVSETPLILVPIFDEPQGIGLAVKRGHHVLIPRYGGDMEERDTIVVPRLRREQAQQALLRMDYTDQQSNTYATLARRSFTAFRRQIAPGAELQRPLWARAEQARAILPALLLGTWHDSNEADRKIVEKLAGSPYIQVAANLTRWMHEAGPPLRRVGDVWLLASKSDAWELLYRFLTNDDLTNFEQITLEVLATVDVTIEQSPEQRLASEWFDKTPKVSGSLRGGLADTLGLMGARDKTYSDGTTSIERANLLALQLFRQAKGEWRLWHSLSGLLPLLAEAAPDIFLDAVADDLASADPALKRLFSTKENEYSLFGSSAHVGLLWALENLAWNADYLGRAAFALAHLARLAPTSTSNHGNQPHRSLEDIFLCWLPHTAASLERRLQILDVLRTRDPEVSWRLLCSLLPKAHAVTSPTHTPIWRDWVPDPQILITHGEFWQAADAVAQRLFEDMGDDAERWQNIVSEFTRLPESHQNEFVQKLLTVDVKIFASDARLKIWHQLRRLISHHREFADAEWALPSNTINDLERAYYHFMPVEVMLQYAWLYSSRPALLNPPKHDWQKAAQIVDAEQKTSVRLIYTSKGLSGLLLMATKVEQPGTLGSVVGRSDILTRQEELIVCKELTASEQALCVFARSFVFGSLHVKGQSWAEDLLFSEEAQSWESQLKAAFYVCLPYNNALWDRVEAQGMVVEECYWTNISPYGVASDIECERALVKLLQYGRPRIALHLAASVSERIAIRSQLLVDILQKSAQDASRAENDSDMFVYHVEDLMNVLDSSGEVDNGDLARLEWIYLPLLESQRGAKILYTELSRNPEFFVQLLELVFRAEDEQQEKESEDAEEDTKEKRLRANRAYELLRSWRSMPGRREDGTVDAELLHEWVEKARDAVQLSRRSGSADRHIGHILAFSPVGTDGVWPDIAVRNLLEGVSSEDIERGIATQIYNNRGVVSKSLLEGGIQERSLADRYAQYAAATVDRWPRTATVLRRIAERYTQEGRRSDLQAELEEDFWR